jgi:hypothetical protein
VGKREEGGVRKAKRKKRMVETKAKAIGIRERFPKERVYEKKREKREW